MSRRIITVQQALSAVEIGWSLPPVLEHTYTRMLGELYDALMESGEVIDGAPILTMRLEARLRDDDEVTG